MTGSDFIFDCVNLLYSKYHEVSFKRRGSYIGSPDCKKGTINPKNDDDRCFQYATTIAIDFAEIEKDP